MMGLRTALFLVGTFSLVSCKAFLPTVALELAKSSTGKLTEIEHDAPFISNFIQEGTNIFFKPHFSMTPHLEKPHAMIVEDKYCDKAPLKSAAVLSPAVIEEPLKIVETVIPSSELEPSYLKKIIEIQQLMPENVMSMPMAPAPVLVSKPTVYPETPKFSPMPLTKLPVSANDVLVPELPTFPIPTAPLSTTALVEAPFMIPERHDIPAFTVPELPALSLIEAQHPITLTPELTGPVEPVAVMVEEPAYIPEAPALPPFKMPELPTPVAEIRRTSFPAMIKESLATPEASMLSTLIRGDIPAPIIVEEPTPVPVIPALEPIVIPEAPVFPPFGMPELPTIVETKPAPVPTMIEEPGITPELAVLASLVVPEVPVPTIFKEPALMPIAPALERVVIPEAPVLPPFVMPELPTIVEPQPAPVPTMIEEPMAIPEAPVFPTPVMPTMVKEPALMPIAPVLEPVVVPEAPVLPPFVMPDLPTIVEPEPAPVPTTMKEPVVIPEAPIPPTLVKTEIYVPTVAEELAITPFVPAQEPVVIPEAPVLPPFVMPELPNLPVHEVMPELRALAPIIVEEPLKVPEEPLFTPTTLPELPSPVVVEEKIPVKEFEIDRPVFMSSGPAFPQQPCDYHFTFPCLLGPHHHPADVPTPYMPFVDVPQAPFAPFMPAMLEKAPIHNEWVEIKKDMMPSLPSSLSLPTECAQNVIAERILPNMVGQAFVSAPALTNPVAAPYIRL